MDLSPPRSGESLACLADLAAAAEELSRQARQLAEWEGADAGTAGQGLPLERRLALVEQMAAAIRSVARDGNRFRRMQARGLYTEGLTMAQLAAVFGVSRQRMSVLLHDGRDVPLVGGAAAPPESAMEEAG